MSPKKKKKIPPHTKLVVICKFSLPAACEELYIIATIIPSKLENRPEYSVYNFSLLPESRSKIPSVVYKIFPTISPQNGNEFPAGESHSHGGGQRPLGDDNARHDGLLRRPEDSEKGNRTRKLG